MAPINEDQLRRELNQIAPFDTEHLGEDVMAKGRIVRRRRIAYVAVAAAAVVTVVALAASNLSLGPRIAVPAETPSASQAPTTSASVTPTSPGAVTTEIQATFGTVPVGLPLTGTKEWEAAPWAASTLDLKVCATANLPALAAATGSRVIGHKGDFEDSYYNGIVEFPDERSAIDFVTQATQGLKAQCTGQPAPTAGLRLTVSVGVSAGGAKEWSAPVAAVRVIEHADPSAPVPLEMAFARMGTTVVFAGSKLASVGPDNVGTSMTAQDVQIDTVLDELCKSGRCAMPPPAADCQSVFDVAAQAEVQDISVVGVRCSAGRRMATATDWSALDTWSKPNGQTGGPVEGYECTVVSATAGAGVRREVTCTKGAATIRFFATY